ncbi:IS66 family insertion sequence hypothetical protein [Aliivibrio salmonicida]|uniref:Transposase n=1 Tax=Aliivibrio salmonicida (strain LFI1238) TaxID=316275 RepID=B6EHB3_ALISL|nr:hypothetical protein [Aliivibrio salmonicida]AZL83948.1 IS66 family insertion sequence hypothetical protein [Aliivibrio salmonicida]AZL86067.1 IS66 family insertion sequence hypothetical protein [Aliivibrio salmonicida]AZL86406.1 IS66 family insertion sequence hypothetical protein [Aliivibrio salmonicida]CAQ78201.1 transposase [Aliivibrio salmonicida LFI1238]CAQ80689.1 transposase [Aliivibrio salmonicida LFI1238]
MQKDKKRTPEQWHALFESQQSSKLSAAEFCRNHNILPKTFSARKARWKQKINATPQLPDIQLSIGKLRLTLPANTEPHWIGLLLKGYQS